MRVAFVLLVSAGLLFSCGCMGGSPPEQTTTTNTAPATCVSPLVRVGGECCLDDNGNGVCDRYDVPGDVTPASATTTLVYLGSLTSSTSTLNPQLTSTTVPVTAESSTTTVWEMYCRTNGDCGSPHENLTCVEDTLVLLTVTPTCIESQVDSANVCVKVADYSVVRDCEAGQKCSLGECVEDPEAGHETPVTSSTLRPPTTSTIAPVTRGGR